MRHVYVAIAGTWSRDDAIEKDSYDNLWVVPGSDFHKMMQSRGIEKAFPDDIRWWSGGVDGTTIQALNPTKKLNNKWISGGYKVYAHIRYLMISENPPDLITLLGHSHGGQVCAYALSLIRHFVFKNHPELKTKVNLITIDTPVNPSMKDYYKAALECCQGNWLHLHSKFWTRIRILGTGTLLQPWNMFRRGMPKANNYNTGQGHSTILHPENIHFWDAVDFVECIVRENVIRA